MCIHKYYIFTACGHSFFGPNTLRHCNDYHLHSSTTSPHAPANITTSSTQNSSSPPTPRCLPQAHPYHTIRLHDTFCLRCAAKRYARLQRAEQKVRVVEINETKWRVWYASGVNEIGMEEWSRERERRSSIVGRTGYSGGRRRRS
jgi:hypothetical protein